jgi:hypothetical protein
MAIFERKTERFVCLGMDLTRPIDSLKPGKYAILKNVRIYQDGSIKGRSGLTVVTTL